MRKTSKQSSARAFRRGKRAEAIKQYRKQEDVPALVSFINMCAAMGIPVGTTLYDRALTDHPKYFPEAIAHRKRWDAIPKEVHEEYRAATANMFSDRTAHEYGGKGLVWYINHPKEYDEYRAWQQEMQPEWDAEDKVIHDKYYKAHGVEKV